MKKIIVCIVISALMLPVLPAVESDGGASPTKAAMFQFGQLSVMPAGDWLQVSVDGCTTLQREGEPMLPYTTHTMTFPLGTAIEDVEVSVGDVSSRRLDGTVAPAPKPMPLNVKNAAVIHEKGPVYESNGLYPSQWVRWNTGAGLHHGEHVTFLTLQAFPARYAPQTGMLQQVDSIQVEISYQQPSKPSPIADDYDLLIMAPQQFSEALQRLVEHKEAYGLDTKLVTLDEIYRGDHFSAEGRDNPEQVKYFIKNALEEWGVTYVMLVGDADVFPTRYVVSDAIDGSLPSDLYYADVYHANGSFAVWDEDSDDTFGERVDDDIDTYPDVAIGRLPADTIGDVQRMVDAIIEHEEPHSPPADAVFVGTELFWDTDISEGDYLKEQLRLEIPQLDVTRLYERDVYPREAISSTENVVQAVNDGTTFLNFASHGYPGGMAWEAGGWSISDVEGLHPARSPVVFAMACSTNQFDTTDCLGETFLLEGNAVGYIGSVRVAYVYLNEAITTGLSGALDMAFYRAYRDGVTMLGETFARAQTDYLLSHPFSSTHDHFTLLEYNMLGDPTIRLPSLDGTSRAVVDQAFVTDGTVTVSAAAHGYSEDATLQLFYRRAVTKWASWQPYGEPREQPWQWHVSLDEGEGRYEFYTVLHDGNYTEPEPGVADAACILDTEPPVITLRQPSGGLYIAGRQLITWESDIVVALGAVDVVAEIKDEAAGVDTVTYSLDGETLETATAPPYRLSLQAPLFGSHEITVSATDRAGNTATNSTSLWFFKLL